MSNPAELWAAGLLLERIVPERESARKGTISYPLKLSGVVPEARSVEGTPKLSGFLNAAGFAAFKKPTGVIC